MIPGKWRIENSHWKYNKSTLSLAYFDKDSTKILFPFREKFPFTMGA